MLRPLPSSQPTGAPLSVWCVVPRRWKPDSCSSVQRNDTDVEIEATRADQLEKALERRLDQAAFDASDRRLGHPGQLGQAPLAQARPPTAFAHDLTRVHGPSIRDMYLSDALYVCCRIRRPGPEHGAETPADAGFVESDVGV